MTCKTLPDLEGTWRISRRIIHQNARFHGTATFTRQGDDLVYAETGQLHLLHTTTDAYRSYIYRPNKMGWQVLYDDGRAFLNLQFQDGVARDTHDCWPDLYRAVFKIRNENEFLYAFAVNGPRKNYFAVSRLTRV